ncbi:MAG: helix-turn-helix transcriptional regulator [Lachnospiraceae bacterium]|nr:helix-turn-helix transcriptional regulator [Lachnospiraceae bacterium]
MSRKYIWETPEEINRGIANKIKNIRKRRKLSQLALSELSGVSYGSIKRFEATGDISLKSLTRIAIALNIADDLKNIFSDIEYSSLQEVINENR